MQILSQISHYAAACLAQVHKIIYSIKAKHGICSLVIFYPAVVQYSSAVQGHCSLRTSPARGEPSGSQRCWPVTAVTEPAWYWHCQTPEWSASKTPHGLCGTPTAEKREKTATIMCAGMKGNGQQGPTKKFCEVQWLVIFNNTEGLVLETGYIYMYSLSPNPFFSTRP